jgi:hypothetical protein
VGYQVARVIQAQRIRGVSRGGIHQPPQVKASQLFVIFQDGISPQYGSHYPFLHDMTTAPLRLPSTYCFTDELYYNVKMILMIPVIPEEVLAMPQFTERENEVLVEFLEEAIANLREEIAASDNEEYRTMLKERKAILMEILSSVTSG